MARKTGIVVLLAVAVAFLAPSLALAAIQGSVHDILTYNAALPKKSGSCSQCHIPHKAGSQKLFSAPVSYTAGWLGSDQPISQVCFDCHQGGTTFIRGASGAAEVNPFGSNSKHGYTVATLTAMGDIASLPTTVPVQTADLIKCTSCHDVHSNTSRPFLRFMTAGGTNIQANCQTCHANRPNASSFGTANPGNHPTDVALADAGTNSPMQGTVNAAFGIAIANPGSPNAGDWNLGGHRTDGTTNGNFSCQTCHAVHGNETANYAAADGATQVASEVTGINNLLVLAQTVTASGTAEPVCVGCHGFTLQAGPGAATTYSHPVGTASNAWSISGLNTSTVGYQWGDDGTNDIIVCESCHDIHFTVGDAAAEGATATNAYLLNWGCGDCHAGTTAAGHHKAGVAVTSGTSYRAGAVTSSATDWVNRTQTPTATAYVFPGGQMTCDTCHSGGNAKAHNNTGTFPGLVGIITESDMCVDCHGFNPSQYTANAHGASSGAPSSTSVTVDSTHYVGPISATVGTRYKRTAAFSSGVAPKYANADGANGSIICESCHTLKFQGAVTPKSSSNVALATELSGAVGNLLEASGNNQTAYDASGAVPPTGTVDLCTGCHGNAPGGSGSTHPVLANMTTGVTTNVTISVPFSASSNSRINCESCHRPHDAAGGSGALILESCGTDSTRTAFDGVNVGTTTLFTNEGGTNYCSRCHTSY